MRRDSSRCTRKLAFRQNRKVARRTNKHHVHAGIVDLAPEVLFRADFGPEMRIRVVPRVGGRRFLNRLRTDTACTVLSWPAAVAPQLRAAPRATKPTSFTWRIQRLSGDRSLLRVAECSHGERATNRQVSKAHVRAVRLCIAVSAMVCHISAHTAGRHIDEVASSRRSRPRRCVAKVPNLATPPRRWLGRLLDKSCLQRCIRTSEVSHR